MRKISLNIAFVFCVFIGYTQNLVPNPSFEDTIPNPAGGFIEDANGWINCGNTPDYYNAGFNSDGLGYGVPNCFYTGYQNAFNGNAFAGLALTAIPQQPAEFIGIQLTQPLTIGTKYYVSAYISQCDQYPCATNNFCFKFFNSLYYSPSNPPALDNYAHVRSMPIVSDSLNWQNVGGSFIADSAYQYLIMGNFFNLIQTDTFNCVASDLSCYYIDNVCVSSDSTTCLTPTGILYSDLKPDEFKIYPNPATDFLSINNPGLVKKYSLYNYTGEICRTGKLLKGENSIDVRTLSNGLYILQTEKFMYKILITNP